MKSFLSIFFVAFMASLVLGFPTENDDASPEIFVIYNAQNETDSGSIESEAVDIDLSTTSTEISNTEHGDIIDPPTTATPEAETDMEAIEKLMLEFKNFAANGFSTAEILKRLGELETKIQNSSIKYRQEIEQDTQKLNKLNFLLSPITNVKTKLAELDRHMNSLTNAIGNIRNENLELPLPQPLLIATTPSPIVVRQTARATLYRSRGHSGRTYFLDFQTCDITEECCKNFVDLNKDSQSINTHDTCVKLYKDRNCSGDSREFYPGSSSNHGDFGSYNDMFSSGKPCNSS